MKKVILFSGLFLSLISFASAQSSLGSLGDLFSSIPSSTIVLGVIWIASFALVYFSMLKMFRGDVATSATIAFAISVFITWAANKNLDVENLFSGIGISSDFLSSILPIIIIGIIVFLFIALKTRAFLILGGAIAIIGFTNLVYEKTIVVVFGIILLGVGIWLEMKNRNRDKEEEKHKK